MPVTDAQVAALRALLSDDMDLYRQVYSSLDSAEAKKGYAALVTAAFGIAVERRLGTIYQPADVVTFVADVRARSDRLASRINPDVAQRAIQAVLGHGTIRGLDREAVTSAKLLLLGGLIADARLDDTGLDEFLAAARKLADQLMS
jgi:hypothetical protein